MVAHECYIAMLEMDDHLLTLNIKVRQVIVEPMKALEDISLDKSHLDIITHIGTQTDPSICQELIIFLKNNLDAFTWSHEDLPGINPSIMVHQFNVSLSFPLV